MQAEGSSLPGGLGITARTAFNLPKGLVAAGSLYGLPALGRLPVTLHRKAHSSGDAADRMATLLAEALELILLSRPKVKSLRADHNGFAAIHNGRRGRNA